VSADAEQCYDCIAHVFASLDFQAFGVLCFHHRGYCHVIINSTHEILPSITGLGESVGFMTAVIGRIIQGLCQGNSAAPAGWSLISTVLIKVYKSFGHGAYFVMPISQ
jgi:hypothetical protein